MLLPTSTHNSFFLSYLNNIEQIPKSLSETSNICSQHNDCPINAHCQYGDDYTKGQCVCNIGYVMGDSENQKECYPVAQTIHDQCQFDAQCMITLSTDSECRYNACQCKEGTHFVPKENKCYASVRKFIIQLFIDNFPYLFFIINRARAFLSFD